MLDVVRKLFKLLTSAEKRRLVSLFIAVVIMGLLQVAGIGSILPFIALLSNRNLVHQNPVVSWVYTALGFGSTNSFLVFVGVGVLVLLVASNVFIVFTQWLIMRFSWDMQVRLSALLLSGYLRQPYEAFINRNTADIGKNILIETQQLTGGLVLPFLRGAAYGVTALAIVGFLFWLNPRAALLVGATFGMAYGLIYLFVRRPLIRLGNRRMKSNMRRFKAVNEAFGGLKEVKILGRENDFVKGYQPAARSFADSLVREGVLGMFPRYAIEALAFGLVMTLFLILLASDADMQTVLPMAGAFVLAGYRLLPAVQQIYQSVSGLRFNVPVLDTIYKDLTDSRVTEATHGGATPRVARMPFEDKLELCNLSYCYPNAARPALRGIDLTVVRNEFVAFVGSTGAGKTTLADVVLGLLVPQSGGITVDGVAVTSENRASWQSNIGYVPQDIYLTDDTIAANIAYGVPGAEIDRKAVERAARIANIHDFIVQSLDAGYDTVVGERGVRLSGGQRQRIGIARALYHDPGVLVLDEATSALDNETERRIVEELDAMRGGRTLIVIAHRLSTVRHCSRLYVLRDGQVAASGSYDELLAESDDFRRIANQTQWQRAVATS